LGNKLTIRICIYEYVMEKLLRIKDFVFFIENFMDF